MPRASRLEKLRRHALVSGRIAILLVVAGTAIAVMCVTYVIDSNNGGAPVLERTAGWWLLVAFALATYDVARVHRPAFARRPRALFGRFDPSASATWRPCRPRRADHDVGEVANPS